MDIEPPPQRMPHNHVYQSEDGVVGCPACEAIDPWHMTDMYSREAYMDTTAEQQRARVDRA